MEEEMRNETPKPKKSKTVGKQSDLRQFMFKRMKSQGISGSSPAIYLLIKLVLIIPVATACVERVFSGMTYVKNKLRNSLGDQLLNDCLITFIEKELFLQIPDDDVMDRFQKMKTLLKSWVRHCSSLRSKSGRWKSAAFIIAVGMLERFSYYGISTNMVSYLTGKLGQSTASAAAILNAWYGASAVFPILGAFVADSFSGRFRMIVVACVLYVVGLGFLSLSALLTSNSHLECKPSANNPTCSVNRLQLVFFFVSFYLVALAQGGFTPCVQAFGAEQFDEEDETENKAKSSFFNWWYCLVLGGVLVPLFILTYIQENVSWVLGFGVPAIVMCFSLAMFLIGSTTYRFRKYSNGQNPFVRIHRVIVRAVKNRQAAPFAVSIEEEGQETLAHKGARFKFLEKAVLAHDGSIEDEKICSIRDIEDTQSILSLAPFWCACLGYSIIYAQPSTLFTKQASTLDRHITPTFQLPAASLQHCFIVVPIILSLPIYDRIFVPIARAITKKPSGISMLQRIGTGLFLSFVSIVFAAFVETKRLAIAREYGLVDNPTALIPMSVWWLAPQYVLSGVADTLAMVGLQEFFYDQVPAELKSVGLALYLSILGVGSFISSFLVSAIQNATKGNGQGGWFSDNLNRAHLDYFYWLLAGLSTSGFVAFIFFSKSYVYKRGVVLC